MTNNLNWKSSAVISNEWRIRKKSEPFKKPRPAPKVVDAHEEKMYVDASYKGGFRIARVPEDEEFLGALRCHMWLKAPRWVTGEINSNGTDENPCRLPFLSRRGFRCRDGRASHKL